MRPGVSRHPNGVSARLPPEASLCPASQSDLSILPTVPVLVNSTVTALHSTVQYCSVQYYFVLDVLYCTALTYSVAPSACY